MREFFTSILCFVLMALTVPSWAAQSGLDSADEMSRIWNQEPIYESGVYEREGFLFSVICLENPNKAESRNRSLAASRSSQQLYRYALEHLYVVSDQRDLKLLKYIPGQLKVEGHVNFSSTVNGAYVYVFATKAQNVQISVQKIQFDKLVKNELHLLIENPKNYIRVFEELKIQSLKQLAQADAGQGCIVEIIEPYATVADGIDYFKAHHSTYPLVTVSKESFCPVSEFNTPILKAICRAGGVVLFDSALSDSTPQVMPEVLKRFQSGKELQLTIYLLESAAERTPRNAQVWEYLEAAYRANKEPAKARMATNVWFLLDRTKRAESIKKVLQYEDSVESKDFLTYLSDKGL